MFYINDFQVIFVGLLHNVWTKVEPAERILIGLHKDEFVSFDDDVELVTDAFDYLSGLLFSKEYQRLHKIKCSLGLVKHF